MRGTPFAAGAGEAMTEGAASIIGDEIGGAGEAAEPEPAADSELLAAANSRLRLRSTIYHSRDLFNSARSQQRKRSS